MSGKAKATFDEFFEDNATRVFVQVNSIVTAYAGSTNAKAELIPGLFESLVELFKTGEVHAIKMPIN